MERKAEERTAAGYKQTGQPEGMRMRKFTTGNTCGGSLDHHRSKEPLLSDVQGVERHCSLSPHCQPLLIPRKVIRMVSAKASCLMPATRH